MKTKEEDIKWREMVAAFKRNMQVEEKHVVEMVK